MGLFSIHNDTCDICGAPLAPEDMSIHLCKICQSMQFEDEQAGMTDE